MVGLVDAVDAVADLLRAIPGSPRVYEYLADGFRPPGYMVGQPTWSFTRTGPCWATAELPIYAVHPRQHDRQPQRELLGMVEDAVEALAGQSTGLSVRPLRCVPQGLTQGEVVFPGYLLTVEVVI